MKRFLKILSLYVVLICLVIFPIEIYKMRKGIIDDSVPGKEVRDAIRLSKTKMTKKIRKLILGDSTGHALYPNDRNYDDIVSLTCNQAITLAGHYFLLKNYLETNEDNMPEEIVLLYSPFSLSNDLDLFAYQYFLKPFPMSQYAPLYMEHLTARVKSIPLYWTAQWPFIQTSGYTPSFAIPAGTEEQSISTISTEYLHKMDSIAKEYEVPLRVVPTPIRADKIVDKERFINDMKVIGDSTIASYMKSYIEQIEMMPSEYFCDDFHLYPEYVPVDYLGILE